jgi:dynein heavy chain
MRASLTDVVDALAGVMVHTRESEETAEALGAGAVPPSWSALAPPSTRPLAGWLGDVAASVAFFAAWVAAARPPASFPLGGTRGGCAAVRE